MKCRLQSLILSFVTAFALSSCLFSAASAQTMYTIVDLGTLGGTYSAGLGINAFGEVTGASSMTGDSASHVFLYSGGTMTDLGTLGGTSGQGNGINAFGQVTGYSLMPGESTFHAFLYSGGTMTDLGTLVGLYSIGYGINASGQVTGGSSFTLDLSTNYHAFLYADGTMKDLETMGGNYSVGLGINDSGQVTGGSGLMGNPVGHAFLYSGGTMNDLGTLGGTSSQGRGINAFGQVVGDSDTPGDAARHVFLYSGGTMSDLGTLSGSDSVPSGVNDFGLIVGQSFSPEGRVNFLYAPGTGFVDLNTLLPNGAGWQLTNALGINDAGQITGVGINSSGLVHAFLLSPVTVPFSEFEAKLQFIGKGETHFRLRGSFTLGADSNGLNPLTQQVLLQLSSLPIPIQKGLFSQDSKGEYVFQGVVGSAAIDFRIKPVTSTTFKFEVEGLTGTPFPLTHPARFILMIGSNKTMGTLPWR